MKYATFISSLVLGFAFCTLTSFIVSSQEIQSQQTQNEMPSFSEAELAQMLAPIALYPDSLLTHILIASTYPIEIIEAHRWLKKNDHLDSEDTVQAVDSFDWDASVKALVPFETVLSRLSEDLNWTQQLGDAFLQDEARVLESIQALREQAKRAGNLDKMDNMDVSYEDENIIIEPIKREVVYVPYYDTRIVYGNWHWSSYPPVYWNTYSNSYVSRYSPFYWHSGVRISFNYFFSAFHWHNRHIIVGNPYRSNTYRPRRLFTQGGYAKRWSHQPIHRKGVSYRTKQASKKYHSKRVRGHAVKRKHHSIKSNSTYQSKLQRERTIRKHANKTNAHKSNSHKNVSNANKNKGLRNEKQQHIKQRLPAKKHVKSNNNNKHNNVSHKANSRSHSARTSTASVKQKQVSRVNRNSKPVVVKHNRKNLSKHNSTRVHKKQSHTNKKQQ